MDPTQTACCEALDFFFETEYKLSAEGKKILILQGVPGDYVKKLKGADIDLITYHAGANALWSKQEISSLKELPTESRYDLVIHFAMKSEQETALHLSVAENTLKVGGEFIGLVHNRMGATRYRKEVTQIFDEVTSLSKSKSRLFFGKKNRSNPQQNSYLLNTPKPVAESEYSTLPGVYGEKAIDKGSLILAKYLRDEHWSGIGADIGCGFGYLTGELLKTRHRIKQLWLYDIDSRALAMAKKNLALDDKIKLFTHWVDVCKTIPTDRPVHWVVMNPPFHSGINQDFELGKTFIRQAAKILSNGSPLFMVANIHLPYEDTLHEHFRSVVHLGTEDGFKCYRAIK